MADGAASDRPEAASPDAGRGAPGLEIVAYTDGACSGNPGPGGWGALLCAWRDGTLRRERAISGGEAETTNNRMELTAAIRALESISRPSSVTVVTDSVYVRDGITQWIGRWKRNGWRTSNRKPVRNAELWKELDAARSRHDVRWEWIKGHAGHPQNERADALAREAMEPFKPGRAAGNGADSPASLRSGDDA